MISFLSIGLFLITKKPIVIKTDCNALLIHQVVEIIYKTDSLYDLDRVSEILDLHIEDLSNSGYIFYKKLIATRRDLIKQA